MKLNYKLIALFVFVSFFAVIVNKNYRSQSLIPKSELIHLDGPDKALAQNLHMIKDRKENSYPFHRLNKAKKVRRESKKRGSERDFGWQPIITTPGRSRAMLYNNSSNTLFSGSVTGGLWKNTNFKGDVAWSQVTDFKETAVNCLAQDPNSEDIIYLGTGESFTAFVNYRESTALGSGIYSSTDGGTTWNILESTSDFFYINDLVVRDENDTSVIYAAVGSGEYRTRSFGQEGLYRSTNQGETWEQVLPEITGSETIYEVSDIEISKNGKIYVSTMRNSQNLGGSTILSSDDGVNWSVFANFQEDKSSVDKPSTSFFGRSLMKVSSSNSDHLYAMITYGYKNSLNQLRDSKVIMKQSINNGTTWTTIPLPRTFNIPWHAMSLAIDPSDENRIITGGLDLYELQDASLDDLEAGSWKKLSLWYGDWYLDNYDLTEDQKQYYRDKFVHADIHDIQFLNGNSNEMLITSDGGLFYSTVVGSDIVFKTISNNLNTTQFYHASIHPENGRKEVMGGTQDNGTRYKDWGNNKDRFLSSGDGAYSFFDSDDKDLKISSVYNNGYYASIGSNLAEIISDSSKGLFINPGVYDDDSNLLYTNTASSSYGGDIDAKKDRYQDTIQIINFNKHLNKPVLSLESNSYIKLDVGLTEAITALQLFNDSTPLDKTMVIGTENGKVFKITGLPYSHETMRIDNEQLPNGYISSIDVGMSESTILVTISNFGLASIWTTLDGGTTWTNIERNLPDIPVRWGRFNPKDDNKVMIATEMGIWGLENISDTNEIWQSYNNGLPSIRVDMFALRESDNQILAATHGQGLYIGTYKQDSSSLSSQEENVFYQKEINFYPNPASDFLYFDSDFDTVEIYDINGNNISVISTRLKKSINVEFLRNGLYIVKGLDKLKRVIAYQKMLIK